jgi:hypothetical protein
MDDEAKFWITVLVAILLAVVLMGLGCTFINCWHMHRMAELGYEERIVPGRQSTLWQKLPQPVRYGCDCPKVTPLVSITNYVQEVESYWTTNRFDILVNYVREAQQRVCESTNYWPFGSNVIVNSNGWLELKED